jgi:hypothetical protein
LSLPGAPELPIEAGSEAAVRDTKAKNTQLNKTKASSSSSRRRRRRD